MNVGNESKCADEALIQRLYIAAPCDVLWEGMEGDERTLILRAMQIERVQSSRDVDKRSGHTHSRKRRPPLPQVVSTNRRNNNHGQLSSRLAKNPRSDETQRSRL